MVENAKRDKRAFISEEDIHTVLQRYPVTTVLALLQELAQVPDDKFDWNAMVKNTKTGITNPREYQMLWRHLAYHTPLVERVEADAEPLDDDSDLDCEMEAIPNVAPETSAEAAACVKVLIASGMLSNSALPNSSTVEAPLILNIPNRQATRATSESLQPSSLLHGTNITVPVTVQKQTQPAVTAAEGLDTNGISSGNLPPRRKRKPWSAAEDLELIAAVNKCGEGNWANILKGDFKSERSASQLSQRWNIIRKRKGNSSLGGSSQLSEVHLAARRAMSLALNMPMTDKLKASSSSHAGATSATMTSNSIEHTPTSIKPEPQGECDAIPTVTTAAQRSGTSGPTANQDCVTTSAQQTIVLGLSSKPRVNLNTQPTKPSPVKDDVLKAAAVAAGARIATPYDAASLIRAAQAKNAVHIMPGGSVAGSGNSLPSNVHFIRTGLATTFPYSTASNASRSVSSQGHSVKHAGSAVQGNQKQTSPKLNVASEATKAATSSSVIDAETKNLEDITLSSAEAVKDSIQDDKVNDKGNTTREKGQNLQHAQGEKGNSVPEEQIKENRVSTLSDNHMSGVLDDCGDDNKLGMDICEDHSVRETTDEPVPMDTCANLGVYVKQEPTASTIMAEGDERNCVSVEETQTMNIKNEIEDDKKGGSKFDATSHDG